MQARRLETFLSESHILGIAVTAMHFPAHQTQRVVYIGVDVLESRRLIAVFGNQDPTPLDDHTKDSIWCENLTA